MFDIFTSSMNEKQNWIVRNKREFPLREDPGSRKGIAPPLRSQYSLHKVQNPLHTFMSLCNSQTQPRHSVKHFWSPEEAPQGAWKGQSVLCHSLLQQEIGFISRAVQRSPTSSCPHGLGRIKPQGRKTKDLSPHCPILLTLERCSSRTPSSWHFSHSLL